MSVPIVQRVYPDAELVTLAILDLLVGTNPGLVNDTFLRDGWQPPLNHVLRTGGAPDNVDVTDYPIMRVASYGADRMAAWNLAAQGEGMLIAHRGRSVHVPEYDSEEGLAYVLLDSVDIAVGGQQIPDVDPDDRRVVKDYVLGLRRRIYYSAE